MRPARRTQAESLSSRDRKRKRRRAEKLMEEAWEAVLAEDLHLAGRLSTRADEPTDNLDPDNAETVIQLLAECSRDGGTVLLVTHGEIGDNYTDRVLRLEAGRLYATSQAP